MPDYNEVKRDLLTGGALLLVASGALLLVRGRALVLALRLRETLRARPWQDFRSKQQASRKVKKVRLSVLNGQKCEQVKEILLCGRANEVAALATSSRSKRVGDGEDGGDQEESKDRHLMGIKCHPDFKLKHF